jgi:hypothetical protein
MPFWWYSDTKVRKLVVLLQRYFASTLQPNAPHRGFANTKAFLHWLLATCGLRHWTKMCQQENEDVKRLRSQGKSEEELKLMGFKDIEMSPFAICSCMSTPADRQVDKTAEIDTPRH